MNNELYPMNTAELMDRAVHVYKKSFGKQLAFAAIFGVISYLASIFLLIILIAFGATFAVFATAPLFDTTVGGGAVLGMILLGLAIILPFAFLWYAVSSAGHIVIAGPAFFGYSAKIPVGQLPRIACRIFGALIAQAIASLPFVGLVVLGAWSGFAGFMMYNAPWILVLLSLILVVAFLVYLNVFSLAVAVAVFERKTFFNALGRSWQLIRGEFWKVAGTRLIWTLVVIVIGMSLSGGLALVNVLVTLLVTTLDLGMAGIMIATITSMIVGLLSIATAFLVAPLSGVFYTTLYFNQRIKKEGFDIEVRLERLLT